MVDSENDFAFIKELVGLSDRGVSFKGFNYVIKARGATYSKIEFLDFFFIF